MVDSAFLYGIFLYEHLISSDQCQAFIVSKLHFYNILYHRAPSFVVAAFNLNFTQTYFLTFTL